MDQTYETGRAPGTLHRRMAIKAAASGVLAAVSGITAQPAMAAGVRVSKFGVYEGYSEASYDGWVRTSLYVPVRDGTKLAVDVYRPTKDKALHAGRLPVAFQFKRYQRAIVQPDGSVADILEGHNDGEQGQTAQRLVRHGYVIVSVDRRGTGASFGVSTDLSTPQDATDGYDIVEWLAKQPWCSGKVGMFGASYEGEIQPRVASTAPPHLKCIMPEVSPFDWYWTVHAGGIHRTTQGAFAEHIHKDDTDPNNGPVDADKDRSMLKAALAEHEAHNDYSAPAGKMPYRDSKNPVTGEQSWLNRHGGHYAPSLAKSGIAIYHITGWFSNVSVHQLTWMANARGTPQKLLIGPWGAGGARMADERALCAVEAHRFFDYWLKDVKNGIMDEPAIHSSIPSSHSRAGAPYVGLPGGWPPANQQRTEFFLDAGRSGSAKSVNDGRLTRTKPSGADGKDDLTVRYDLLYRGGGENGFGFGCEPVPAGKAPIDHSEDFDAHGLTYTTEALEHDIEVTGHGQARLWVSSTADDGDFFLKIEDVDPSGASGFVGTGSLRASYRVLGTPPYDYMGLPWQRNYEADLRPLEKDGPTELVFALFPTSYLFRRGHRMRVTITCSDLDVGPSPQVSPAPVVSLHRSAQHTSSVILPINPAVGR